MNEPAISMYGEYRNLKRRCHECGLISGNWRDGSGSAAIRLLMDHLGNRQSVLDLGADDRYLESVLRDAGFNGLYRSADTNEYNFHDYRDFLAISDSFECILMFELIEHLSLETGMEFIEHAFDLLPRGGLLSVSTPNSNHPTHFWHSDITHLRPWPASSLWAILRQTGFEGPITVYRQHTPGVSSNLVRATIRRALLFPSQRLLSRIMDVDYAQNILVFAEK